MPDYRLSEYDRKRQEELNRVALPALWIPFFLVAVIVLGYLFEASGG